MGWGGGGKGGKGGKGGGWGSGFDFGKMKRAAEQAVMKDAKNERESGYFWEKQAMLGKSPPHALTGWKLQEEEKTLFGSKDAGNVGIDFDKYDDIPVEMSGVGSEAITPVGSFSELWDHFQLPDFLWANIERCRYTKPTPIQRFAIPVALNGYDAMCCAQTGSGKTCAFLVPILCAIDETEATGSIGITIGQPAAPKAVILAPTRELCSQIHLEARKLSFASKIRASEVYGGVDAKPQLWDLALGSDIVTATPGRLTDFINRGVMTMSQVRFLCLDEADRMLDMGFEPQIREIVQKHDMPQCSDGRLTLMFSATFPKEIQKLAQDFMRNYIWVGVGRVGGAVDTVEQHFQHVNNHQKEKALLDLLWGSPESTLIFTAMKRTAASLVESLNRQKLGAVAIHGDMEQPEREASLNKFRKGVAKLLVATDVAARGLDIPVVSHVVNYDLPENIDDYVHRIGRTGRIGRHGRATSFYASEGNWANTKILGKLINLLEDAGKEVPDFLRQQAQRNGIKSAWSGAKKFGGADVRGGATVNSMVSRKGAPAGKGLAKGAGLVPSKGAGKGIVPAIKATGLAATASGVKRPIIPGVGLAAAGGDWKRAKW